MSCSCDMLISWTAFRKKWLQAQPFLLCHMICQIAGAMAAFISPKHEADENGHCITGLLAESDYGSTVPRAVHMCGDAGRAARM